VKLKITIDDHTYEVEVEAVEPESPTAAPPRGYAVESAPVRMQAAAPAAARPVEAGPPVNEDKVARSPVTGTVVRVLAQPGQSIQVGDVLLVLEAMKMETNITAPVSGKLAAVKVEQGASVQSGQVVVEFE
jgi:methylmalonyl-CoA carboxyltransferase small subunit